MDRRALYNDTDHVLPGPAREARAAESGGAFADPGLALLVLESATDSPSVTTDRDGIITSWNIGAEKLLGWSSAQAVGQHGRIFFTTEDQAAGSPENEMRRSLVDGRAEDERWHMRRDGSRFWGSGLMMPLQRHGEGEPRGFLKMMRDRTAERAAEQRYQMLTDALPGFVFACDTDGRNVQVNAQYREYTGRGDPELLGDRWLEALHPDDRRRAAEAWADVVRSGAGNYLERYRFCRHDDAYRSFECRATAERDDAGRVVRWIGTCVDVEDAAVAQAQLERLNRGLEHAVAERTAELERQVTERLQTEEALRQSQKMEAIGQLTGGVAHDFNNLLTVIRASADLLRRGQLSEEKRRRYIDAIADTADRAAKLTGQLLAFARRQALKPEVFDVSERLDQVREVLRTLVGSQIEIVVEDRCPGCRIEADPSQFETALVNMAANARDAMPDGGRLTISLDSANGIPATRGHAAVPGDFLAVSVADTGQGIAPETLERVFEPFFTTKEVGKGTGLGLSQVFGFAKQSGGEVIADSAPGRGTSFAVYLPRSRTIEAIPVARPPEDEPTGYGRVLVVEDNQLVGEFAAQLLQELGYATTWAMNGLAALEVIETTDERFDLVLTDVVMPGMGGVELAQELRRRDPTLPVVLTSGYSHVLASEGTHGFELLHKPYSVDALSRVLRRVMPKP